MQQIPNAVMGGGDYSESLPALSERNEAQSPCGKTEDMLQEDT
jgi:hypothetical protein